MSEPDSTSSTAPEPLRQKARTKKDSGKRAPPAAPKAPARLDQLQDLLTRPNGANIAEMMEATGWQQHSVRGAIAGALKKRGLRITSEKVDGLRRYRAEQPA